MRTKKTSCVLTKDTQKKLNQLKLDTNSKSLDEVIKLLIKQYKK
jgi:hypothetical protein